LGRKILFAVAAVLLGASSARAEPVSFRFDGTITGVYNLDGEVDAGQGFSVLATWDTARPGFASPGSGPTTYEYAYDRLEMSIGGHTYTLNRPNAGVSHLYVWDDAARDAMSMYLELGHGWFDGPALTSRHISPWYLELSLGFPATAWGSLAPPSEIPSAPASARGAVYFTDAGETAPIAGRSDVTITSVHKVPEPGTLALLAVGTGAAFLVRRRRRG
jgi:hypothetical protein